MVRPAARADSTLMRSRIARLFSGERIESSRRALRCVVERPTRSACCDDRVLARICLPAAAPPRPGRCIGSGSREISIDTAETPHLQRMLVDLLAPRTASSSRSAPKGSSPRMPMTNGALGSAEHLRGPLDEMREVVHEHGLDLEVFRQGESPDAPSKGMSSSAPAHRGRAAS